MAGAAPRMLSRRATLGAATLGVTSTLLPAAISATSLSPTGTASGVQWLRWTITRRRSTGFTGIQVSELDLRSGAVEIPKASAAEITNPGGDTVAGETVDRIFDASAGTKWLDRGFSPDANAVLGSSVAVIRFSSPVTFDAYRWWTANDADLRDPVSWTLEVATVVTPSASDWDLVDQRGPIPELVPTDRQTATGWFALST